MKLKVIIGKEIQKVVYIDYQNGVPHSVLTAEKNGCLDFWDFFANDGDKKDLKAYNSGGGGHISEIQAPQYANGYIGKYWLAADAKFKGKPKNAKRLKTPLRIFGYYGGSINPFKVSEITHSMEYCDRCGHNSIEFCTEHKYDDNEGNERYIDNNEIAE